MRTLEINKQKLWYALQTGKTEVIDEYGNHTGVFQETYANPVLYPMNVSESRGTSTLEPFGITSGYDRSIVTTDMSCPIKEDTLIWFGADPATEPHNYVVYQVANSLNGIVIKIRGVDVTKDPVVSA